VVGLDYDSDNDIDDIEDIVPEIVKNQQPAVSGQAFFKSEGT
jgi:hypothetical protein